MPVFDDVADLLARLGPYTHGKSCLYVKSLDRVDRKALQTLIERAVLEMRRRTNNGTTPFVHGQRVRGVGGEGPARRTDDDEEGRDEEGL